jgi:hypothetical protein
MVTDQHSQRLKHCRRSALDKVPGHNHKHCPVCCLCCFAAFPAGAPTTLWNVTSVGDLGLAGLINPNNFADAVKNLGTELKSEMTTALQLTVLKNAMETIAAVVSPANKTVAVPDPAQVG